MEIIIGMVAMLAFVGGIVAFVVSFAVWPTETKEVLDTEAGRSRRARVPQRGRNVARWGGLVAAVCGFLLLGLRIVPAGSVGVVLHAGSVDLNEKGPGINWVVPFIDDIRNVETRVQGIHFGCSPDEAGCDPTQVVNAASREYQDVFLTGVLNVHVDPTKAAEIYQGVGLDYNEKLTIPFYKNIVKEVVPQFGVAEVLPQREQIRILTVQKLQTKLAPYGIVVDDVALSNVDFNAAYNEAIQDKQIQELKIATERNILEQRKIQADQAVAQAEGEANAAIERARGEAESNRLVSASLTDQILINRYIEKFNDNVEIILVPQGEQFILDPSQLLAGDGQPAPPASPAP